MKKFLKSSPREILIYIGVSAASLLLIFILTDKEAGSLGALFDSVQEKLDILNSGSGHGSGGTTRNASDSNTNSFSFSGVCFYLECHDIFYGDSCTGGYCDNFDRTQFLRNLTINLFQPRIF